KGEILATDKNGNVVAKQDSLILMPLYQKQGDDGFFLIKSLTPD
ncbi:MAG: succinylglutamate desuccinylase, partial [Saprospiraceae bacterium]